MHSASSLPPHIHPPIAQVPSAMREPFIGTVPMAIISISVLRFVFLLIMDRTFVALFETGSSSLS
jgi:hypothetical protein